jgi:hypothetical protein
LQSISKWIIVFIFDTVNHTYKTIYLYQDAVGIPEPNGIISFLNNPAIYYNSLILGNASEGTISKGTATKMNTTIPWNKIIFNTISALINQGLENYSIPPLLQNITLSSSAVTLDAAYCGVYQGYNVESDVSLVTIDISTNGSVSIPAYGWNSFINKVYKNDNLVYLVNNGSPNWLMVHYNSYGYGPILESLKEWYTIFIINTTTNTLQNFQILVEPVASTNLINLAIGVGLPAENALLYWYGDDYFYKTKLINNSSGTIDLFTSKSNTTNAWTKQ